MVGAPDFDRNMLLLAAQLSHESDMKTVLLSALEAILHTLKVQENAESVGEAITLTRCIIKLVVKLLSEPGANM